jgi:serine/threonine protein kinase
MELLGDAREIGDVVLSEDEVDQALTIVRQLWDAGVAHRDIKPSNVLVAGGRVHLIDVAFATVRPTPWREAVDLANMMLTAALSSDPELVYMRALRLFSPDELAEAFAANRGVTVPTQLRSRLRADGRDVAASLRRLAPNRPPLRIQLWSVRRVAVTLGALGVVVIAVVLAVACSRATGLL